MNTVQVTRPSWPLWGGCGTNLTAFEFSVEKCWLEITIGKYCCEIVKMSRADLHPMLMRCSSTSDRPSRCNINVREQEEEIVVSVLLVASDEV